MEHLFTHGTRGEPTKMTEIGEMPESWEIAKLLDLCRDGQGFIQTGPFGSQLHSSDYKECGVPVVNPTHLGFNTINEGSLPFISTEDADRLSKHYLIRGDILISRRGDFSRYSYITDHQSGWLCGTGCILIRINHPNVDNYFLSVLMGHKLIQDHFDQNSVGSIMPNLNTKILVDLPVILPHVEEQKIISGVLLACDIKIAALDHEAHLLDELFRVMLEELMSGGLSSRRIMESIRD
jgi:type I restriction enzyme S subunit